MNRRLIACGGVLLVLAPVVSGFGMPEFKKEFELRYVTQDANPALKKLFQKEACSVCHVQKQDKTHLNKYGNELAKLIPGNADDRIKSAANKPAEKRKLVREWTGAILI